LNGIPCDPGEFDEDTLRKEKQVINTERRRLQDEKLQLEIPKQVRNDMVMVSKVLAK